MGPDRRPSRSWSCGSWIYNYLCNLCISPLKLWVRIPFRRGVLNTTLCDKVCQWLATRRWFSLYNIMWYSLSVTCDTSVVFSIQHYVIKFVSDLRHVGGFHRFLPLIKLVTCYRSGFLHQQNWPPRYKWNIVENGVKHPNPLNMHLPMIIHTIYNSIPKWTRKKYFSYIFQNGFRRNVIFIINIFPLCNL
jgi:hypothetical protein